MNPVRFPGISLNEAIISKTPQEVLKFLLRQAEEIQTLQTEILALGAQVERLENLLGRNSSNSNQPPSEVSPEI